MADYNWNERHIITFPEEKIALSTKDVHVYYGKNEAIKGIDMQFEKNKITALIGPSGCGKSTYLRSLNRMNDTIDIARDRKSTRLNSSHQIISYAVFCLKK